jgi:predicted membrane protein
MEENVISLNYAELFIALWIILSLFVGIVGFKNKIGFSLALVWSIVFSPIVGLFIVLRYEQVKKIFKKKSDNEHNL